ncbi:unnamed protein product [Cladocopium goreaui]|uniref:Copia protein n=1 Tax=Cladocopium goreaui TaxID=2562237 RepID=A0A9P1DHF8_9DINO|nr:unnamed protein product [Cladocopium goreaui]
MLAEDEGSYLLKSGTRKRLSGNVKQLRQMFSVENKIYEARTLRARSLRRYGADIIEIYAGMGNITAEALEQGLRAVQPIDAVHGISLESRADFQQLRCFLKQRRPFLTVWEIRCDPWSNINHLNYDQAQLQVIRDEQRLSLEEMRITIEEMKAEFDGHFLLENPWGTPFWQQPDIMKIQQLPGAELRKGSMCRFGLRGRQGKLLQKNTGWCSDLPLVLDEICLTCNHNNSAMHEPCLGGNSKRAQVYTRQLAKALIQGLMQSLKQCGDERWMHHFAEDHPSTWTCGLDVSQPFHDHRVWATMWDPTMSSAMGFEVYYVDIIRNEEVWRPILQEVRLRLEGKVSNSAIVKKGTAFFEQIQALVPWTIHQAQIVKSPKVRRLPQIINQLPITHRAAILQHTDGRMTFETEEVQSFATGAAAKFSNPVSFGILVYGEAPATSQPLALADQAGPSVVPVPVFAPSTEATTEPSPDVSRRSSTTAPTAPSAAVPQTPVIYLPPTPALPAIQEEDEPNPTRSGSKITTEGDTSLLKLADGPLALDDRRQSASSARAASSPRGPSLKRETTSTESELPPVRQAKLPAEQGTKRIAEEPVEALARQDRQTRMQEPASASAQHVSRFSVFPLYCKECGTKPDISSPDAVQCARCFHHEFVNDPILVSNWFDEVEERDAMSQQGRFHYDKYYKRWIDYDPAHVGRPDLPKEHEIDDHLEAETYITGVGQMFNAMPEKTDNSSAEIWSVAVKDKEEKNDWQWWHVFENIAVHPDSVLGNFLDTAHKKIFLRHGQHHDHQVRAGQPDERHHKRHARHCSHITGWDGSPPELQPAFQHSAFATAYHAACHEVAHGRLEVDDEVKRDMMNDLEYDKLISLDEIKHNYPVENAQVFTTSTDEVLFNADSSDDESSQTSGRAAKQALKREIPWKTIPKQDWPSFIEALKEEWREWELWSSCKPALDDVSNHHLGGFTMR